MTIRNQHLKPLIEVNQIIKGNIQLKKDLPKSLICVLAAQKNLKTLAGKEKEFSELMETAKLEVAVKDEKGQPKIIVGENPKDRRYEIPEERQDELLVLLNNMFSEPVEDIRLSVFSQEAGEEIIKYLNSDQSTVFIEFLLEKEDEDKKEVVIKKLEPTEA